MVSLVENTMFKTLYNKHLPDIQNYLNMSYQEQNINIKNTLNNNVTDNSKNMIINYNVDNSVNHLVDSQQDKRNLNATNKKMSDFNGENNIAHKMFNSSQEVLENNTFNYDNNLIHQKAYELFKNKKNSYSQNQIPHYSQENTQGFYNSQYQNVPVNQKLYNPQIQNHQIPNPQIQNHQQNPILSNAQQVQIPPIVLQFQQPNQIPNGINQNINVPLQNRPYNEQNSYPNFTQNQHFNNTQTNPYAQGVDPQDLNAFNFDIEDIY